MEPATKPVEFPIVPLKYAGLWIAWNHESTRIIASARTFQEAKDAAVAAGENDPILEKAPKANVRFVGIQR
jgi:hypothetical protein